MQNSQNSAASVSAAPPGLQGLRIPISSRSSGDQGTSFTSGNGVLPSAPIGEVAQNPQVQIPSSSENMATTRLPMSGQAPVAVPAVAPAGAPLVAPSTSGIDAFDPRSIRSGDGRLDGSTSLSSTQPGLSANVPYFSRGEPGSGISDGRARDYGRDYGEYDPKCQGEYRIEKRYQLVGSDYYMTEDEKNSFDIIFFMLLVIIIFITLWIVFATFTHIPSKRRNRDTDYEPPFDPDFVDMDIGGSRDGKVLFNNAQLLSRPSKTSYESKGEIFCDRGWFGKRCEQESWDNRFYAFGSTPETNFLDLYEGRKFAVSSKSWRGKILSDHSCSTASLEDRNSIGFAYHEGTCRLLYGDMIIKDPKKVEYDPSKQMEIYLKRSFHPKVPGLVSFGVQGNGFLRSYLERPDSNSYASVEEGKVKRISITPYTVFNPYGYKGIWSLNEFNPEDFDQMHSNPTGSSEYAIDSPPAQRYKFVLPKYMRGKTYYVMYK